MSEIISVPRSFLLGKIISQDIINEKTGEIIFQSNTEITDELLEAISDAEINNISTIYANELDQGAYISDTLTIDTTGSTLDAQVEIYRMMRPGEPPTKEAAENLFNNLFSVKIATSYQRLVE